MNPLKKGTGISAGLAITAIVIPCLCLFVSVDQAGGFMADRAPTAEERVIWYLGIFAVICGSQLITRMMGQGARSGMPVWMLAIAMATVLVIETFSVSTSQSAFSAHFYAAERSENLNSPEYDGAMATVRMYQQEIASLQSSRDLLASNRITHRAELAGQITSMVVKLERAQRKADEVNVSTTGKVFAGMESSTGLTATDVAYIGALLLSLVPFTVALLAGHLVGGVSAPKNSVAGKVGKKRARGNLKSVTA